MNIEEQINEKIIPKAYHEWSSSIDKFNRLNKNSRFLFRKKGLYVYGKQGW